MASSSASLKKKIAKANIFILQCSGNPDFLIFVSMFCDPWIFWSASLHWKCHICFFCNNRKKIKKKELMKKMWNLKLNKKKEDNTKEKGNTNRTYLHKEEATKKENQNWMNQMERNETKTKNDWNKWQKEK